MVRDVAESARAALAERHGEATAVASAPGRVNLIGGHTDYNQGLVLPTAIDRRVAVAARPTDDGRLSAYGCDYDESASVPLDDLHRGEPTWFDYVQGVAWALREAGYDVEGTALAIAGDVPQGAGLASSAALEVATARALLAANGENAPEREVADICHHGENDFVGVSCGIMDQYAVTLAREGHALELDCRDRSTTHVPLDPERVRIVVVDTNASHSHVDSAYNDRVATCERGVELLDERLEEEIESLRDVSPAALAAVGDDLPDEIRKRATHVVHENARVETAAAALRDDDVETLGRLLFASHASLRCLYEVSCAELDLLVDVARSVEGVYGARMTGGGFGGCVVSLVRPDAVDEFTDRVADRYPAETGIDPDIFVCEVSGGVRLL